jgi:hypothetical protein
MINHVPSQWIGISRLKCSVSTSGPVSDRLASGSPGFDAEYHRFHELQGRFLSVAIKDGRIIFRHHNVRGETVYEWRPRLD